VLKVALVPFPDILVLVTVTSTVVPNGDQSRALVIVAQGLEFEPSPVESLPVVAT